MEDSRPQAAVKKTREEMLAEWRAKKYRHGAGPGKTKKPLPRSHLHTPLRTPSTHKQPTTFLTPATRMSKALSERPPSSQISTNSHSTMTPMRSGLATPFRPASSSTEKGTELKRRYDAWNSRRRKTPSRPLKDTTTPIRHRHVPLINYQLAKAKRMQSEGKLLEARQLYASMMTEDGAENEVCKLAAYWVDRCMVEEQLGRYSDVVLLYEQAQRANAQPVNDLRRGLKAFMIRLKSRHAKQEATTNKPAPLTAGETFVEEADTLKTSMATEPLAASIPSEVLPEGPVPEIQPDEIPSVETSVPQRVQEQTATSVVSGVSMQETPVQESAASRDTKAKVPTQLRKDRIENAVDDVLSSVLNKLPEYPEVIGFYKGTPVVVRRQEESVMSIGSVKTVTAKSAGGLDEAVRSESVRLRAATAKTVRFQVHSAMSPSLSLAPQRVKAAGKSSFACEAQKRLLEALEGGDSDQDMDTVEEGSECDVLQNVDDDILIEDADSLVCGRRTFIPLPKDFPASILVTPVSKREAKPIETPSGSRITMLTPMRTNPKEKAELGTDNKLVKVRRSLRLNRHVEPFDGKYADLMKRENLALVPNPDLTGDLAAVTAIAPQLKKTTAIRPTKEKEEPAYDFNALVTSIEELENRFSVCESTPPKYGRRDVLTEVKSEKISRRQATADDEIVILTPQRRSIRLERKVKREEINKERKARLEANPFLK